MNDAKTRFVLSELPEVFFSTAEIRRAVSREVGAGHVRRLGPRLYTRNTTASAEEIVRRNVWPIAAGYFPGAVVADRTALEFKPATDGSVFLVAPRARAREVALPGIRLRARPGVGPLDSDRPFMQGLFISSPARAYLENMRHSRSRAGRVARTLNRRELEESLDSYAGSNAWALNELRDEARRLVPKLGAEPEFEKLDELIGSLYGTRPGDLESSRAQARRAGPPFDHKRMRLFELLQARLLRSAPPIRANANEDALDVFAFFEAYFSNYIEGTEFALEEAQEIVFEGRIPEQRPKDAHDVLGTYRLVADPTERARRPHSSGDLIEVLQQQHAIMLAERPEVRPGLFKRDPNRVGHTYFVAPELVNGTLREGFKLIAPLANGFQRAVFLMLLVAEVHPFADGNGRIARILMNSELTAAGEQRVIVPTGFRDDYLGALRAMSRSENPDPIVRVIDFAQQYSVAVDFSSIEAATRELEVTNALLEPGEAEQTGKRLRLPEPGDQG